MIVIDCVPHAPRSMRSQTGIVRGRGIKSLSFLVVVVIAVVIVGSIVLVIGPSHQNSF